MKHAQLWKRILHEGLDQHSGTVGQVDVLVSPIIVDTRTSDRLYSNFDWSRFRGVCFPFNKFWIETASPEQNLLLGCLVKCFRNPGSTMEVHFTLIQSQANRGPTEIGLVGLDFSPNGNLEGIEGATLIAKASVATQRLIDRGDITQRIVLSHVDYALDTLLMLGCSNVALEHRDNDAKDVRIATKRHGPSATGYRYHVLTVRPAGSKPGTPGVEIGTMPRHVCRGHFSEYGPEFGKGLLFGKYAGRFFVPPHVKGKVENGIVEKDYALVGIGQ